MSRRARLALDASFHYYALYEEMSAVAAAVAAALHKKAQNLAG